MSIQNKVTAFLGKHGFAYAGPDCNMVIAAILSDMQDGLEVKAPGLPADKLGMAPCEDMIPTWTGIPETVPHNEPVIVIDAGGTNFRSCLVTFTDCGEPAITDFEKCSMPGIERELSKKEFFDTIAQKLDHLKNKSRRIGFCFSYPMEIMPDGDGRVLNFSKEIKAKEVVGSLVGASLSDALVARGWNRPEKIILLNDTTAALLAGASTARDGRNYSSYVGFILGTGMNAAYMETAIPKAGVFGDKPQIVVCESGKFCKLPRSEFDISLDKSTNTPGLGIYEKLCSGAYLGPVAFHVLKVAATEGLFTPAAAAAIESLTKLDLIDMDKFLYGPSRSDILLSAIATKSAADRETLYRILDAIVDRSARLATANIAATVIKSGQGNDPSLPVCILCEGTTFLKTKNLQLRVKAYLHRYLTEERGLYWEIVSVDNAITLGTAVAGLL